MCAVYYRCTATASKTASKVSTFTLLFCLLSPWRLQEQYGASSCTMVTSSGLQCSPGYAALGNAACIASTPPHGHRNGLQWRCICLSSQPLLSDQIVAKRPWYGPLKVTPSYDINLIGIIRLFICYWLSPTTMGTVLATVVAGGQARFQ